MRILLVSDHYPPFIGGAQRQTQLLGRELQQRGHDVTVVTVWHPGLPEQEDENGVRVYRLKQMRTILTRTFTGQLQQHQPPFPDPVTVWQLRRLVNRLQPDVVHSYGWFTYTCTVALWGKDIPLLISVRDYGYSCATRNLIFRGEEICSGPGPRKCLGCASRYFGVRKGWVAVLGVQLGRQLLMRKLRGVHSISTYVQQRLLCDFKETEIHPNGNLGIKHAVIPSFGEDEEVEEETEEIIPYLEQLPSEPFILFVGALRRAKGIEHLLAAYQRLVSPPPLVLIGTIEHSTPRMFPPGVIPLENFSHTAVIAAWKRALFGVLPSLWPEPLGSVVYEGMSQGKAVIGSRPGGHTDMIIHGKTGLLVPSGDVDALTLAMQQLLDDDELRERLGQAAQTRAVLFTASVNVPRLETLYQQVINQHSAATGAEVIS